MSLQSFLASATSTTGGSIAVALLLFVGAFEGLKALYRFASGVYVYTLRPGKNLKRLGQWAVVTGSTDGIGRAYANALAKIGVVYGLDGVHLSHPCSSQQGHLSD